MKLIKLVLWSRRLTRPSTLQKPGSGFTLVEVMVALAVVAVAAVAQQLPRGISPESYQFITLLKHPATPFVQPVRHGLLEP